MLYWVKTRVRKKQNPIIIWLTSFTMPGFHSKNYYRSRIYQFFVPPSLPAFSSLNSNSTSVKKPVCPISKVLHCPERDKTDDYSIKHDQIHEREILEKYTYFCHSKPDGLNKYGAKSQEIAMNQLLILRRMYDIAPPSLYPYARYTINKSTTSNLKITKVININNFPC